MADRSGTIGIVGGTGMLGTAIARALLDKQVVAPENLWISNRSGRAAAFEAFPTLHVAKGNEDLADACDTILLSVPPASASDLAVNAAGKLVISLMAGISLRDLQTISGANRVVRAMSSPAAEVGQAYSPWCASTAVTSRDRQRVTAIFGACGLSDEIEVESHIEYFTAMTGPVPGFVAFFAAAMQDYSVEKGIPPAIADRAIRQLFLGAGTLMSRGAARPADHVKQMIDYAGTTAAGLETMLQSSISREIAEGLDARKISRASLGAAGPAFYGPAPLHASPRDRPFGPPVSGTPAR